MRNLDNIIDKHISEIVDLACNTLIALCGIMTIIVCIMFYYIKF